jgi:uncharacterized YccA/Bax inhibitor family protein
MDKSSNPVLSDKMLARLKAGAVSEVMTRQGSVAKTAAMTALVVFAAVSSWIFVPLSSPISYLVWVGGGTAIALICALLIAFRSANGTLVATYALAEGVVLGLISRVFESAYNGIVLQAVLLTFSTLIAMQLLYSSGAVKVTAKFRSIVMIMTVSVLVFFLGELVIGLFSPGIFETLNSGPLGIVISAVIVFIAASNLLLDFDFIDRGVEARLPKQAEWYAAFGLMATLIWLYVSILRLLMATRR